MLMTVVNHAKIPMEAFFHGSILMGLFFGAGIAFLFKNFPEGENKSLKAKLFVFVIALLFMFLALNLELLKEHLGGISTFSGILIAFSLVAKRNSHLMNISFVCLSFGMLLIEIPLLKPLEIDVVVSEKFEKLNAKAPQISEEKSNEIKEELPKKEQIIKSSAFLGTWKIDKKASKIDFELGPPDARTKGIFKIIEGEFKFGETAKKSGIKVQIPLSGFSTFNAFRDEGLLGSEYLDASITPVLQFTAKEFDFQNNTYLAQGKRI